MTVKQSLEKFKLPLFWDGFAFGMLAGMFLISIIGDLIREYYR